MKQIPKNPTHSTNLLLWKKARSNSLVTKQPILTRKPLWIADYLAKHESVSLLLVGSTAGDITDESTLSLSQARADAVKKTLCDDLGIAESRIHTLGMGSSDPWHISNAGYDDGAAASSNRKVTLISADTELAQNLMNNH